MLKAMLLLLGALLAFGLLVGAIVAAAPWIAGFIILVVIIWFLWNHDFKEDEQT